MGERTAFLFLTYFLRAFLWGKIFKAEIAVFASPKSFFSKNVSIFYQNLIVWFNTIQIRPKRAQLLKNWLSYGSKTNTIPRVFYGLSPFYAFPWLLHVFCIQMLPKLILTYKTVKDENNDTFFILLDDQLSKLWMFF
jgi:hypothetical protein